tara:strand:+ start:4056 stop:4553 length:498 start_codon:yes stop_codon:yes gene_type:complete
MGYQLIETIEVGSGGAASMEFTGIAGTGQDLVILWSLRNTTNNATGSLTINGSDADRAWIILYGTGNGSGTNAYTSSNISAMQVENADTANTFSNGQLYISNYASSANKSMSVDSVTENNGTVAQSVLQAISWAQTAAITSLGVNARSGNLAEFSSASLYMITAD